MFKLKCKNCYYSELDSQDNLYCTHGAGEKRRKQLRYVESNIKDILLNDLDYALPITESNPPCMAWEQKW